MLARNCSGLQDDNHQTNHMQQDRNFPYYRNYFYHILEKMESFTLTFFQMSYQEDHK
jgi:hypothetical protein